MKYYLALLLLLLISCHSSHKIAKKTIVQYETLDTLVVSSNNPMDIYRGSEPRFWDILHSRIALTFNYQEKTANGKAWLQVAPYNLAMDSLVLDAKGMKINKVTMKIGDIKLLDNYEQQLRFTYQDNKLNIRLPHLYNRTDTLELCVDYTAQPYAKPTGGSAAIRDDRGLYFINTDGRIPTKPKQIWTQGETQANSHWMPTIDQPNERFTMRLELTVPDSFITLSNGSLDMSMKAGEHLRRDVWVMKKPIQTYAYMFAIGNFSKIDDSSVNNHEVSYYVEPEYAQSGANMFRYTPEMIAYFSSVTGQPYPWNKYSQVVVRDYVSGAMENTSASLFGEFLNRTNRELQDKNNEDVVSHELFHQWFGDYVTAESWSNLTVNESFATYGEQLWRKYKHGTTAADELAVDDFSRYLNQTAYNDDPLVRFHYRDREIMFDRISYQKGGQVLRYLHGLLGDTTFKRAMQLYLTKNALQSAEAHQWRLAVEEASGQDWNWFFNQFYFRGDHPQVFLDYRYDDSLQQLLVTAKQTATDSNFRYRLPLKAALYYNGQEEVVDFIITKKKETFTFPYKNGLRPMMVPDCYYWLPGLLRENKKPMDWWQEMKVCRGYANKRRCINGAFFIQDDSLSKEVFHLALKDQDEQVCYYALLLLYRVPDKNGWHEQFKQELLQIAKTNTTSRTRAAALDALYGWKIKDFNLEMKQLMNDSSYRVKAAALNLLNLNDSLTAYNIAQSILPANNMDGLDDAAWEIVALNGREKDTALYAQYLPGSWGGFKRTLVESMNVYLLHANTTTGFEGILRLLTALIDKEEDANTRYQWGRVITEFARNYNVGNKTAPNHHSKELIDTKKKLLTEYKNRLLSNEKDEENLKKYKK